MEKRQHMEMPKGMEERRGLPIALLAEIERRKKKYTESEEQDGTDQSIDMWRY